MRSGRFESPAVAVAVKRRIASYLCKATSRTSWKKPASVGPSFPAVASSSTSVLCEARRCKSYHFFMNLDDPEATRLRVEDDLERLASEEKKGTTAYLHGLLNLTLSHYQREDFIAARDLAEYTHTKAVAHNSKSSFLYFTATTCARCGDALATAYEAHVEQMAEQTKTSAALTPAPSVVFSAKRTIAKLRADAARYRVIADRVYHRPDMAFMRGSGEGGGRRHWNSSRPSAGSDTRHAWQDGSSNNSVDEEYAPHVYGEQWQNRRKRPEHVEMKRYYQRQYTPSPSSASEKRWTVPK
ncbi:hypothetical protein ABB37_02649 [Leptomonas pyrrhocoris]|uniref:Uncharacterized protein n=1 Tax=Leptomonas pyrrhocoris TaxID=157538 RepID=A0A0N0DXF3_LEPPY|nr:hypothetical protein ABB37_02649 [Leptomonas pyrrhocoris]KPA82891.1 hypothetical protein ABB37_02649 [Leptomonas pyrrhocoris]|eukprot:XP_015661330.1 hypothetical protein ABB37_02649 [Leptomonas pyrrhocoris]